jgi:hypothetical protein
VSGGGAVNLLSIPSHAKKTTKKKARSVEGTDRYQLKVLTECLLKKLGEVKIAALRAYITTRTRSTTATHSIAEFICFKQCQVHT